MNDRVDPVTPWSGASTSDTAFFLDVDGTLLGFQDRPQDVVADASLLHLLERLHRAAGGALALVSGRMISDLDRIVAPLLLPAAGVHGADIRFADGQRLATGANAMDPVRALVQRFVADRPGLVLEDKGATIAIHYRHAPERQEELRAFLAHAREGHDVSVQDGKLVAELKPTRCNKGDAILSLLETAPFAGRRSLFVGDDLTDEHGFEAVNAVDGISVKVGSPGVPTKARYRVPDPFAVRQALAALCPSD